MKRGRGSGAAAPPLPPAAGGAGPCALPRGCIPQRRLRPLSAINAICIGIGCNKSCKSLTAEGAPLGADTAEPSLLEPRQRVNGAGERPRAAGRPQPEGGPESPEEAAGRGGRRLRTAFSAEQIGTLESSFQRHRYLGAAERRKLAGRMRLSEVQIKTWFQNRRMKLKRQLQELRPEAFCGAPLPYGPQSGVVSLPLTCAAPPPALPRQEAAPGGFALAALPAPTLDLSSACRAQPVCFWAAPCFVGYRDPRAFLLGV
ncbi:transcription factor LBX2-like isoform X1 [Anser cygnoides]|uniref:transcription factor LBX2-like isoform X1 n=1 Tax=Anser cygnoides TaxID=8845 RepID=UPI0020095087|nr:transcription factor LBX2-like isoform X1 [Anser cygnoides]